MDLTSAKVLADSIYDNGPRLVTLECTFPRFVLAEINTHRMLSRNSASSRAIPIDKQIAKIMQTPFIPARFPINQPGMSATNYHEPGSPGYNGAMYHWLSARNTAAQQAQYLVDIANVHKQIANRLLEPFMWHTAIISATLSAWESMFVLRISPDAQPEFRAAAVAMSGAIDASTPTMLNQGEWHAPLLGFPGDEALDTEDRLKVSVGRVARVSYLSHEGIRDTNADLALFTRLQESRHLSPFEHVATPSHNPTHWANMHGWRQVRSFVETGTPLAVSAVV